MLNITTSRFERYLESSNLNSARKTLEILQVNMGKLCNQACKHCHVDAGPGRTELMKRETVERILQLLADAQEVHTLDITGGAPELNPYFRYLVKEAHSLGKKIIDRCNLTVLLEDGQNDTPEFLAEHGVEITASLPCYSLANVDKQRGTGTFDKSIEALRLLNRLGYGKKSGLKLNLVYNPVGASLPPPQHKLAIDYKRELAELFGIEFNQLFVMTNMPVKRFRESLERTGKLETYQTLLEENFNPQAAENIMCRSLVSVSYDGYTYDCDFNQMLEIPTSENRLSIWDIESLTELSLIPINFANHCFGCTAGAGSSCGGKLV